jgi:hypothetical protein
MVVSTEKRLLALMQSILNYLIHIQGTDHHILQIYLLLKSQENISNFMRMHEVTLPYHIAAPLSFSRKVLDWETKINQTIGSSFNAHAAYGTHTLHTISYTALYHVQYTALNHVQMPSVINNITESLLRLLRVLSFGK